MLKRLSRSHDFSKGFKNASFLAAGNIISELITFVTFTFVARYFLPQDYGIYTTVLAYVGMFQILTLGGVNKSVVRRASEKTENIAEILEKGAALRLLFIILAITVCNIGLFFVNYDIKVKTLILVYSLSIYFHELTSFYYSGYYVINKIKQISFQTISSRLLFAVFSWLIILLKGSIELLVLSSLLVSIVFLLITRFSLKRNSVPIRLLLKPKFYEEFFKSGIIFSVFGAVTMLATKFDVFIISILGNTSEVAIYGVAFTIAGQAIMLRNVNQDSFFPIIVKRLQKGMLSKKLLFQSTLIMFLIPFLPTCVFFFFSREIITFLFGNNYADAGPILSFLMIYVSFAWGTLPFTVLAQSAYKEKVLLKVRIWMAVANVALDFIFFHYFGLIGIAYVSALVWSFGSVIMCFAIYKNLYPVQK